MGWNGTIPNAFDARIIGVIVLTSALAASVNAQFGGPLVAVGAFAVLVTAGIGGHVLGERRLRRITNRLVTKWVDAGGAIERVTRSSAGLRTEWVVHTKTGAVTIGGLALAPISTLSVDWQGTGDAVSASVAEQELDRIAEDLYKEIFEFR